MTSQPVGDRDRSLVRLGVIGCGDWGCNHVRTLAQMGCLTSICDPDPERLARAAALAPAAGRYQTVAELVGAGVDGVIVATPAVTHRQVAEQVMRLGCDALVEKPLALSVAEAVDLAELAGELGRVLMVGHVLEYHPGLQAAFSLIHDGAIGRPLYAYSNRLNFGKVRTEESILWSFAPHDIALMLRLGGSSPVAVRAQSAALLRTGIPDVTVTHLDFPDLQTHIFVSWLHPFKEQRFVVVGADGMLSFDGVAGTLTHHHQSVAMEDGVPRLATQRLRTSRSGALHRWNGNWTTSLTASSPAGLPSPTRAPVSMSCASSRPAVGQPDPCSQSSRDHHWRRLSTCPEGSHLAAEAPEATVRGRCGPGGMLRCGVPPWR